MEVQSIFTCQLPDGVNLVDYVFEYFDEYGDREALVSIVERIDYFGNN